MLVVTDIAPQKKRRDRFNIYLDGKFWTGMTADCLLETQLAKGTSLSEQEKLDIEKSALLSDALSYAVNSISRRMLSEHMLREKLDKRGYSVQTVEEVVRRAKEMLLLNDELFAEEMARSFVLAGHGIIRIDKKLSEYGIPDDLRESVIRAEVPASGEFDRAVSLAQSKYPNGVKPWDKDRCHRFLVTRGYSSALAVSVLESLMVKAETDEFEELLANRYRSRAIDRQKAITFLMRKGCPYSESRTLVDRLIEQVEAA